MKHGKLTWLLDINQGAHVQFQENRAQPQGLPTSDGLHNTVNGGSATPDVPTDATIDDVVPAVASKRDNGPASPTGTNVNVDEARLDPIVDLIHAHNTPTSHLQAGTAEVTVSETGVVLQSHNQEPFEFAQPNDHMMAAIERTTDDALGPVLL